METKKLLSKLSKLFPKRFAALYHDRVGLMYGKLPKEVNKVLLCLDFDDEVLPFAIEFKPDLIITHHPFIYGTKAKVLKDDEVKKNLCDKLDNLGFTVYSYHTNFDAGKGGMNDALAEALGLLDVYASSDDVCMRIGYLNKEMDIKDFAKYAKEKFGVSYSLLINKGNNVVKKVGIIGGGGSHSWKIALKEGCDIYISGDAPHHVRRSINLYKFNYLDMPHEIEKIFIPTMNKILKNIDSNLEILTIDHEKLPEVI